jgi:hypothetical protein
MARKKAGEAEAKPNGAKARELLRTGDGDFPSCWGFGAGILLVADGLLPVGPGGGKRHC